MKAVLAETKKLESRRRFMHAFVAGFALTVAAGPGAAVLSVRDTGLGIASEDLPHIFERFYRSDRARSSAAGRTGLGLAITNAIVESHGGTTEVATVLGKGSTFTVRLPGLSSSPPLPWREMGRG